MSLDKNKYIIEFLFHVLSLHGYEICVYKF